MGSSEYLPRDLGNINVGPICEAAGMPHGYLNATVIQERLLPSIAITFTDGEFQGDHEPDTDPIAVEQFGATNYYQGVFGERLRQLAEDEPDTEAEDEQVSMYHQANRLVSAAAVVLATQVIKGRIPLLPVPSVSIDTEQATLRIGNESVPLNDLPRRVIDYGPGTAGRFHIQQQIKDHNAGRTPYGYVAVAKGPFVNEFLMSYWTQLSSPEFFFKEVLGNYYAGREDGIAAASNHFVRMQEGRVGNTALADIVIASSVHSAGHQEIETGIRNAHALLDSGGKLVIRAPRSVEEASDYVPADAMVRMADQAGFNITTAAYFETMSGPNSDTETVSAVFTKQ